MADSADLIHTVSAAAQPLTGAPADFDVILEHAADASVVLIGEASHGTHDC
ncbi:MAG: hypothetical protein ACK54K_00710 [Gemmatimonadaceae bacterium]